MADERRDFLEHVFVSNFTSHHPYQRPPREISTVSPPPINRGLHGPSMLRQLDELVAIAARETAYKAGLGFAEHSGLVVVFEGRANLPLALESIENQVQGIELLNVRSRSHGADRVTSATVFVPDGKLVHFERAFRAYVEEDTAPSRDYPLGRPRHQDLTESIAGLRRGAFDALWTDPPEALPADADEVTWWEVWLPVRQSRSDVIQRFRGISAHLDLLVGPDEQHFRERSVLLMRASRSAIEGSIVLLDCVAELRRPKQLADFYLGLGATHQREHVDNLLGRLRPPPVGSPAVCLLDTGVNWGHPLFENTVTEENCLAVDPSWSPADEHGHGTELAGVALFGDLVEALSHQDPILQSHGLESVKVLRQPGENDDPRLYGSITSEAIARSELAAPRRKRVFNLALSAGDSFDHGRPSAWSTAVDEIAYNNGGDPRLVIVAGGNVSLAEQWLRYPASNQEEHIHDPGQAWNAVTVGSHTAKFDCTDRPADQYQPIANEGGISPFSTTSTEWSSAWPFKPDVVFEGGNAVRTDIFADPYAETADSSMLLTASDRIPDTLFATTGMTSASAALASRFAAQIMARYPAVWPETVRALMVHSASWTEEMKRQFLDPRGNKAHYASLLQHCGFGVPNLDKAMWSAQNSLTLIVEGNLQPFQRAGTGAPKAKEMDLHQLPWPKDVLEGLDAEIRLRVTLSYFVEPNFRVFGRGLKSRYTYESHGLRFKVKTPQVTDRAFLSQVTALAEGDRQINGEGDARWMLGEKRFRGSLVSDVWTGPAADLASRGTIAVFPTAGWWKTRTRQGRYNSSVRYSMVVSIEAPELNVDLYTSVATQIDLRNRQVVGVATGI